MKEQDSVEGCIGLLVVVIASVVLAIVLNGWALSVLWSWFVVGLFDLPSLTIGKAIGLSCVVSFLVGNRNRGGGKQDRNAAYKNLAIVVLSPIVTVATGWIIHVIVG